LSGGAGSRLWPLSRELYPKQLLALTSDRTLLQETALRLDGLEGTSPPLIVCNEEHRFMVAEQMRQIKVSPSGILLEPIGRNTAPAVALAALYATSNGDDPLLLVLPADHVVKDVAYFQAAIYAGCEQAEKGYLLTFGVVPDRPETGYGYIRTGESLSDGVFAMEKFVEKPDLATAEAYLDDGRFCWNSGMFLFKASRYLEELERYSPAMLAACRKTMAGQQDDLDFTRFDENAFRACPADSIDYAVMEKTDQAAVVPLEAGWSDVGSWSSLADVIPADHNGNVMTGDVVAVDCHHTFVHSSSRLVAAVGLDGYCVVETKDAVLVMPKDRDQDVKQIVERLKKKDRGETTLHRRVNRPWGAYEGVDQGEGFQVKHLTINPGARLSLQKHKHRAEHWVVVRGIAQVTKGVKTFELKANESTYIPAETLHRLENNTYFSLEIIEVQSGDYLGEDDIVRFDDIYGRKN
jgi:mannose-1-phosphate guanylyltransferase/mannose-6-phosphate isomerase